MEQHRLEAGGRSGLFPEDMGTQGYNRRSWANPCKLRLSRQTWMILLVMILIMVAWKSRSAPAKGVNLSKQRQEIPAPIEVKHIRDNHVVEDTTMENDPISEDQSGVEVSPSEDDKFSTPTAYDINEDMISPDDTNRKIGDDGLFKIIGDDSDDEDDDDDAYSTPTTFDADTFSEDMQNSKDSIGKYREDALLKQVLNNEESKVENVKYTLEKDTFNTPPIFDIKSSIGDMLLIKESEKEDEKDEPTQKAQENTEENISKSRDSTKEDSEDKTLQQNQENNVEVITRKNSKGEKEDMEKQKAHENSKESDTEIPLQQVQENKEEVMVNEDSKEEDDKDGEKVIAKGDTNGDNENDGEKVKVSEESKGEGEKDAPKQQDNESGNGKVLSNKITNEEAINEILPQQLQEIDKDVASVAKSAGSAPACSPHNHIMFLKTHKCASSTVQNILLRYGYQNDLFFALSASHYLGHPKKFNYNMMNRGLLPASGKADILTLHSRLNIPEHQKAMYPDAKWITIVRDPVEQFESLYNYYELKNFYKMDLASFLNQSVEVLRKVPRWESKHGRNTMLFDMGYQDTVSQEELKEVIDTMAGLFNYVMIAEKMDESLILLRNELCWTNHDIIGFTKNARIKGNNTLSRELADKIIQMNKEDTIIYNHFLQKHIKSVENYGIDKMSKEVSELQKLRQEYYDYCVAEEVLGHDKRLKGNQEWKASANAYLPNNSNGTCRQIIMKETNFVDLVRNHQKVLIKSITT